MTIQEHTMSGPDQVQLSGPVPLGMPLAQSATCLDVRDMIYLAAHDSAFAGMSGERLAQMLTHHVARKQVTLLRRGDWPVAFGLWARLSTENLKRLMVSGYPGMQPSDLESGDNIVMVGICAPWRREDFDMIFGNCAATLDDGSGNGGWYLILPSVNNMPKRLTRFRRTGKNGGVLEEAAL